MDNYRKVPCPRENPEPAISCPEPDVSLSRKPLLLSQAESLRTVKLGVS